MKYYKDYYKILGIGKDANNKEIRDAYRKLALEVHPDKQEDADKTSSEFVEISQAYEILKNKQMRDEYDENYASPNILLFKEILLRNLSPADLEEYVEAGADIEIKNEMGQSIIMVAANKGNFAIVEYLLNKGISPKSQDYLNVNVLMFASMSSLYNFKPPAEEAIKSKEPEEVKENKKALNETEANTEADLDRIAPPVNVQEEGSKNSEKNEKSDTNNSNYSRGDKDFISNKAKVIALLLEKGADPMAINIFNGNAYGIIKNDGIGEFLEACRNFIKIGENKFKQEFVGEESLFDHSQDSYSG